MTEAAPKILAAVVSFLSRQKLEFKASDEQHCARLEVGIKAGGFRPGQAFPFEIDQFPDTIRERVPECDPVIIRFVEEAIRCMRADALLAAAFMIGAASERAINLLIQTYERPSEPRATGTNSSLFVGSPGTRSAIRKLFPIRIAKFCWPTSDRWSRMLSVSTHS